MEKIHKNQTPNYILRVGWNYRLLTFNKELFINMLIEEYQLDLIILCETWLTRNPSIIDKGYDTFRTVDSAHQGACIIAKKGTVRKSFINDESYLMAIELIYTGTIVIGVYMKEDLKDKILEQLVKLLHRIDRKYKNPNIIIYGDFNINSHWTIKKIENKTNLKWATSNNSIITRTQKRLNILQKQYLRLLLILNQHLRIKNNRDRIIRSQTNICKNIHRPEDFEKQNLHTF